MGESSGFWGRFREARAVPKPKSLSWRELEARAAGVSVAEATRQSLTASARRITSEDTKGRNPATLASALSTAPWQDEAWSLYDVIGELRFSSNTLAGRMGQAKLFVGKHTDDSEEPVPVEDGALSNLLYSLGKGSAGLSQLIFRAANNLFVGGEFWLVGIPPRMFPGTPEFEAEKGRDRETDFWGVREEHSEEDLLELVWRVFSVDEFSVDQSGEVTARLETGETIKAHVDDVYSMRIWRPHPRKAWEPDSPTRASLPVLREVLGLGMMVSAQLDSRLAGAGLLLVNREDSAALKRAKGLAENDTSDPLIESLSEAMLTPIKDRDAASATVPLVVTVGDVDKAAKLITFSTAIDAHAKEMREDALRRLALGLDMPPELLLGVGGMNHWGAWLVREDTVDTHLKPPLALFCDALTQQFLRPVMVQMGYSEEEIEDYSVWFDVEHLVARPNRTEDAKDLHERGALSTKVLVETLGFDASVIPEVDHATTAEQALDLTLKLVGQAPSLAADPGLHAVYAQILSLLKGEGGEVPGVTPEITSGDSGEDSGDSQGLPGTSGDRMEVPDVGA